MELKDLVGEHILDAVDFSDEQINVRGERYMSCQVMRFRLDGKVYMVIEDPDDGYRSSMKEITVGDWPMSNVFPGHHVLGIYDEKRAYMLKLIDMITRKVVIEIGTDYTDDYYPSFVANFNPKAMALNSKPVLQQITWNYNFC